MNQCTSHKYGFRKHSIISTINSYEMHPDSAAQYRIVLSLYLIFGVVGVIYLGVEFTAIIIP